VPATVEGSTAYAELRRAVLDAGLLERSYAYYLWRGSLSYLILASGVALALIAPTSTATLILAAITIALGSVQVGLIGHDAGHLGVFKSRSANYALGSLCWSLSLGVSFYYWIERHNRHHAATNDAEADPDLRWSMRRIYVPLLAFAFRAEGWQYVGHELRGRRRATELLLLSASSLGWLGPTALRGWWWIGVLFISQVLAGLYLALAIAPNHIGMPTSNASASLAFLERQLASSRNVSPNPMNDFLFGGLNYQIEHHLFPTMPRNHFARARALVKPFCAAHGYNYTEEGALAAYRSVYAELQRLGRAA
jgi:fatty acid desaturase